MEVSSHALDQHRVDGVHFAAGVLTNVTQDHLDYHGTMERYFEAKAMLFDEGRSGVAVVNRDDRWGQELMARLRRRGADVVDFGIADATDLVLGPLGTSFRWEGADVRLQLGGRFNVLNALAAARAARCIGVPVADIVTGLGALKRVRGRFEPVDAGQDFTVLIDYAHTPDGLGQALGAARELAAGRLLIVFGAGGDRDHDKRAPMGEVTARLADLAIVTSDNPRSEDPGAIIEAVVAGAGDPTKMQVIADRGRAIETALAVAEPGDVVIIAGKGHETGQEIAGQIRPFDDLEVAKEVIARLLASRGPGRTSR
jgi:UDP-N-acetylmuramoyl-L-alanyl-D-glutamate--2,6-diaminopimelate ligase